MATICWKPELCRETQSAPHELLRCLKGAAGVLPGKVALDPSCWICLCLFPTPCNIPDSSNDQGRHLHTHKQEVVHITPTDFQQLRLSWNLIAVKDSREKFSRFMCCSAQLLFDVQLRNIKHYCHQKFF